MQNPNKKGLTLIEVVIAMGLFGIIMVTLYPAFLLTNLVDRTSKEFTDASTLAQDELEYIYNNSTTMTLTETIADIDLNRGYSCSGNVCTKTSGRFYYVITYTSGVNSLPNLTEFHIVVTNPSGEVGNDDRSEVKVVLRIVP